MTSVPLAKWFQRKMGLALSLATTCLGIGGVFFLPITQALIAAARWPTIRIVMAVAFRTAIM